MKGSKIFQGRMFDSQKNFTHFIGLFCVCIAFIIMSLFYWQIIREVVAQMEHLRTSSSFKQHFLPTTLDVPHMAGHRHVIYGLLRVNYEHNWNFSVNISTKNW